MIGNTDNDSIFPLDGVMRLHHKVRNIYQLYGAKTNLGLIIAEGPHKDTQNLQLPVFRWFNRYLKGVDPVIEMAATNFFRPEQLRVFSTLPGDQINTNLHASFVPMAKRAGIPSSATAWETQRDAWLSALNQKTFGAWPKEAVPLDLQQRFSVTRHGLRLQAYDFDSQPNVRLRLYLLNRSNLTRPEQVKLLVLGPHSIPTPHSRRREEADSQNAEQTTEAACPNWDEWLGMLAPDFSKELAAELEGAGTSTNRQAKGHEERFATFSALLQTSKLVLAFVAPRGVGLTAWNSDAKKQAQIRRRFMLLGETLDSMRVWDIRRAVQAVRAVKDWRNEPISLQAEGFMAADALYASVFETNIARLDLWDLPASHTEGPDYLNVLRILDLPQTVAIAAERSSIRLHQTNRENWEFPTAVVKALDWNGARLVF